MNTRKGPLELSMEPHSIYLPLNHHQKEAFGLLKAGAARSRIELLLVSTRPRPLQTPHPFLIRLFESKAQISDLDIDILL